VSKPLKNGTLNSESESKEASAEPGTSTKEDQEISSSSNVDPHLNTQAESNHLVWDLDLPKTKAQLLGSSLQQWNLLEQGGKRQSNIAIYFSFIMRLNREDFS
jgi:hypothetical protein